MNWKQFLTPVKSIDTQDAKTYLDKVLAQRPNFFPARMMQGEILAHNKEFIEAINVFDQLINEEPRSYRAHYMKGFCHIGKGEIKGAFSHLD